MPKFLWIIPAVLINSVLLAAESTPAPKSTDKAPAAESTEKTGKIDNTDKTNQNGWTIEATPATTTVQPGQALDIDVRVVNRSDAKATVFIRALLWYAKSNNPHIVFGQWNARAGRGPVITYKEVTLASKEAYTNKWSCTVAKDTPAGETTFRVGVTLKFQNGQPEQILWSEPVKITVKTPGASNPEKP